MDVQPIFDINIYNRYLYYSGGQHPNFYQYQQFLNNIYYGNYFYYQNMLAQSPPLPSEPMPNVPVLCTPIPKEPVLSISTPIASDKTIQNNCIKGMGCKNIKCSNFHHPSKDLDIIKEIRKY